MGVYIDVETCVLAALAIYINAMLMAGISWTNHLASQISKGASEESL